jgi:hypothetical protein
MLLSSLFRARRRPTASDWWEFFGSFGDDFFGDDLVGDGDEPFEGGAALAGARAGGPAGCRPVHC